MSSPLHGADYLRPPKASGSREEVLARCFEAIVNNDYQTPSMDERLDRIYEKTVWEMNLQASMRPGFVPVGPMKHSRDDDRFKEYRFRLGAVSNN
ncbi:hypothetical protein ACJ2CC_000612 [Klebsiella pneumoniae]|jgi:hypothetical protein|uniref:hypothetical protein n=1 Tax=Klebsiella pneumoniae TaxID=573 RepID=UPI0010344C6C|nr:hypothetical protein [Klebsiella pneumoniae]MCM2592457.1 hypothetical protein [Klebsiella pneumoniae]MEA4701102.1 hypothetical protein [Klebsiella pneumoniae]BEI45437.1 hypothetical protein phiKp30_070 [Klebsiella phage phiKp_30]HBR3463190.1 hypothetical protein [Klebsiella pneumoniae]